MRSLKSIRLGNLINWPMSKKIIQVIKILSLFVQSIKGIFIMKIAWCNCITCSWSTEDDVVYFSTPGCCCELQDRKNFILHQRIELRTGEENNYIFVYISFCCNRDWCVLCNIMYHTKAGHFRSYFRMCSKIYLLEL